DCGLGIAALAKRTEHGAEGMALEVGGALCLPFTHFSSRLFWVIFRRLSGRVESRRAHVETSRFLLPL
ncbi:MAG: hypothetical protein KAU38_14030, partial [Desulfobacterales bacterium]|nr:hypothetical protein [Desulfobacterales bacterium]